MARATDLRAYMSALAGIDDLEPIDRLVDTNLEVAAITRFSTEQRMKAPLFDNVRGVKRGFRMLGAAGALSSDCRHPFARIAVSLGRPPETSGRDLVELLVAARAGAPTPPRRVPRDSAPCKQNVLLGAAASLDAFPVPYVHPADGGRYVNTWGFIVARTPDGRWTNWSVSRVMQLDGSHMTGLVLPQQHLGVIWQEWQHIGEPMPFAIVQGGDPGATMIGGMTIPEGVDEASFLGTVYGAPVDVVQCELVDLQVPAGAEVVIEGHVSVQRDATEGPFAEFHGWAIDETSAQPVFTIEAITHRDDPIWPVCAAGRPPDDSHVGPAFGVSSELLSVLRERGLPIAAAWLQIDMACHWMVVTVRSNWRDVLPGLSSADLVRRIGEAMDGSRVGRMCPLTYVLDDDIDPFDIDDVLWALGTRVHPQERQTVWMGPIMPWYQCYTEHEQHEQYGPIVVHDALLAPDHARHAQPADFESLFPAELRSRVRAAAGGQTSSKEGGNPL